MSGQKVTTMWPDLVDFAFNCVAIGVILGFCRKIISDFINLSAFCKNSQAYTRSVKMYANYHSDGRWFMLPLGIVCFGKATLAFSKLWPSGPILSISQNVRLSVCPSVCPSMCSLLRYRLNVLWPPLPKVGCPIFLKIRSSWG